jgi:predicted transglutaminase-like cysteine proteinase
VRGPAKKPQIIYLDQPAWQKINMVNDFVNARVAPVADLEQYGVPEHWTYPVSRKGDCEDYVLLKRRLLAEVMGFPLSALLVTIVRDGNDGHAVLTVVTSQGEFILDNKDHRVLLWSRTHYRFAGRQSRGDPNNWLELRPPALVVAGAGR